MRNNWFKKGFVAGIIVLFLLVGIYPISAIESIKESNPLISDGNTLYVGGSGPGNYSIIQHAVDNASSGDTVFVYSGIYNDYFPENMACVLINKRHLSLIGENKYTIIIKGSIKGSIINVKKNHFTISGFTLQIGYPGINLQQRTNCSISDMIIANNICGIFHWWNTDVKIYNITFLSNEQGIDFWDGRNCTIVNCSFLNNKDSIYHEGGISDNSLIIKNNHFINTSNNAIRINTYSIDNHGTLSIQHNNFQNNQKAISLSSCKGVNIIENNFIDNTYQTKVSRDSLIRTIFFDFDFKQNWINNYWDNWKKETPKPIFGLIRVHLTILLPWRPFYEYIYLFSLPYFEFDYNPSREPYDIGV